MKARLVGFARFWYEFVIGDDWRIAAGVVVAFGLTYWLSIAAIPSWWLTPLAVVVLLALSLRRASGSGRSKLQGAPRLPRRQR